MASERRYRYNLAEPLEERDAASALQIYYFAVYQDSEVTPCFVTAYEADSQQEAQQRCQDENQGSNIVPISFAQYSTGECP